MSLEPHQFDINEAWIVFQLNEVPISTETDGDFNVLCLMDAASCYILGNEFVSTGLTETPKLLAERLIETGISQAHKLPRKILLSLELESAQFVALAERLGVEVSRVSEEELWTFTSEARDGFQAHIGGGRRQ